MMLEIIKIPLKDRAGNQKEATIIVDNEKDLIQKNILNGRDFYERRLLDYIFNFVEDRLLFIDVGANIGNHSVYMGVALGATVMSFEPNKANFARLCRNMDASGLSDRFHPVNAAVGDRPGYVRSVLGEGSHNTGGAKVQQTLEADEDAVPVVTLDDVVQSTLFTEHQDFLVKIDVEGMEIDVVRGMKGIISRYRPVIICEVSSDKNLVLIRNLLKPFSYMVGASFFKTATFVLLPTERAAKVLTAIADASWDGARAYVEYCRLSSVAVRSRRYVTELQNILGITDGN